LVSLSYFWSSPLSPLCIALPLGRDNEAKAIDYYSDHLQRLRYTSASRQSPYEACARWLKQAACIKPTLTDLITPQPTYFKPPNLSRTVSTIHTLQAIPPQTLKQARPLRPTIHSSNKNTLPTPLTTTLNPMPQRPRNPTTRSPTPFAWMMSTFSNPTPVYMPTNPCMYHRNT